MSLLLDTMETCVILNKSIVPDGYGGYKTTWTDGADFKAAIVLDTSLQARIGEKQGVKDLYTVTTTKALNLQFNDVFRRASDNKIFRVTSNGYDKKTPASATLDMRNVNAEEYTLTS